MLAVRVSIALVGKRNNTAEQLDQDQVESRAVQEIFAQKDVAHRIADTKAAQEMAALDDFYGMLTRDPERAFYGPGHVLAAAEQGAIATLLLSDSLYRCASRSPIVHDGCYCIRSTLC